MSEARNAVNFKEFPRPCYVILHIGRGPTQAQDAGGFQLIVPDDTRFQLREDIWIERLDESTAKNVQQACEPAHYKINREIWDRHLYAFVMQVPDRQQTRYDGLDTLHAVVSLSRLVNPTSTGGRYCAQIMHFGLKDSAILAIEYRGASLDVTLGPHDRDWLSREDGETLLKLMPWTAKGKTMHPRVHRAYWNHEYAMRTNYIDLRWTIVVAGLEALLNVGDTDSGGQFRGRTQKLAEYFKIPLTPEELKNAWKMRSKLVHAESFLFGLDAILPRAEHSPLYERLELLLRSSVRTSLLDENFGNSFKDDASVCANWDT
ncbi:MAG: hypothetical protein ABSC62_04120 [Terracidiphilus sp.]